MNASIEPHSPVSADGTIKRADKPGGVTLHARWTRVVVASVTASALAGVPMLANRLALDIGHDIKYAIDVIPIFVISWLLFQIILLKNELSDRRHASPVAPEPNKPVRWHDQYRYHMACIVILTIVPAGLLLAQVETEPAVYAMALVAIFTAAQHYGHLSETQRALEITTGNLGTETANIHRQVNNLNNTLGLARWRGMVYNQYASATNRIDAVVKQFLIDKVWWQCASAPDPWAAYVARSANASDTLLHVLGGTEAKVQFVTNAALPPFASDRTPATDKAAFFRNFLGLAWHLVIFHIVLKDRAGKAMKTSTGPWPTPAYLRIKIAETESWMHVIDNTVNQIVEGEALEESSVHNLTLNLKDGPRAALSDWARSNVRQFAQRGGMAEEYVCAVLRYAALQRGLDEETPVALNALGLLNLMKLLDELGMESYLDNPAGDFTVGTNDQQDDEPGVMALQRQQAENLFLAIFNELLKLKCQSHQDSRNLPDRITVRDLLCEVM